MTDESFYSLIKKLEAAFRVLPLNESSLQIYHEKLRHISDDDWRRIVEKIIDTEDNFPSISCIKRFMTS
ncbi:MAG: hypothetical protein SFH39_16070 [Candidatus Magnetobacterium sp. LHC-1]|uniref:Uncharacterized protein n=1 Tax=Candidatus Magnetobacterium casense TaxID=1455061 RepID=A0ABS6RXQ9_9BACT|nr:hypothetical protein [Candidatus Magnetobacterium casensis]MBF0609035.1 hypothetical protein [Nitrospirota bacterium]MBV6341414.1 hypothetical protein [Candidatus Magnetobacterium casensis]